MKKARKAAGAILCAALLAAGVIKWYKPPASNNVIQYKTTTLARTTLGTRISATGTLEPEEVIDVGAQVAGKVNAFGLDTNNKPIDYGSVVVQGGVLARIDDSLYTSEVAQAKAQLQQAKAGSFKAQADLKQMLAKANQAKLEWERAQKLGAKYESQTDLDTYRANHEVAQANLEVAKGSLGQAEAQITQAQATLERAERNLGYCTITSPVNGVIIDRRVNIGQTVVASLNTPSLFLIAKDLKRMQVWVSVNEADIGSIKPGQKATFTVDAFPGREFQGTVGKVRLNASMSQNVVTYTVEIVTDNSDNTLIPYLTANVQFHTQEKQNVLAVPNAALHWMPESASQQASSAEPSDTSQSSATAEEKKPGNVWVKDALGSPRAIQVRVGINDGVLSEVESPELGEGMQVIVGQREAAQAGSASASGSAGEGASNPFLPKMKPPKNAGPPPM